MEATQAAYHLWTGRYMSYAPPVDARGGPLGARERLATGPRRAHAPRRRGRGRWPRHPLEALTKQHLQSILVIQPIDMLEDGTANMCDGCPDMTVHEGKLVWSCRLEEPRAFG